MSDQAKWKIILFSDNSSKSKSEYCVDLCALTVLAYGYKFESISDQILMKESKQLIVRYLKQYIIFKKYLFEWNELIDIRTNKVVQFEGGRKSVRIDIK